MIVAIRFGALALVLGIVGCGKKEGSGPPVTGIVFVDENPLAGAEVVYIPIDSTQGFGGSGKTDGAGKFTLYPARAESKIEPGKYKVTISRRLNKDGSEPDPKIPPIESPAVETLAKEYSNRDFTTLTATVSDTERAAEFKLRSTKK